MNDFEYMKQMLTRNNCTSISVDEENALKVYGEYVPSMKHVIEMNNTEDSQLIMAKVGRYTTNNFIGTSFLTAVWCFDADGQFICCGSYS